MTAPHIALSTSYQDMGAIGPHRHYCLSTTDTGCVVAILAGNETSDTSDGVYVEDDLGNPIVLKGDSPANKSVQCKDGSGSVKYKVLSGTVTGAVWCDGEATSVQVQGENTAYTPAVAGDYDGTPTDIAAAADELAARLTDIETSALTAQATIPIDLAGGMLAAGTPLAAFADNAGASAPGITLVDSKAKGVRWNNQGTQTAVWYQVSLPQDLNDAAAIVLHFLVSKTGATVGDATRITVAAFFQTVAALHDADADCGGDSSALTGDATAKTVAELTLSIAAGDVPSAPAGLSFSIKPKDGTLGTDDAIVSGCWIEYTKKLLAA